jgi:hypothetical protein
VNFHNRGNVASQRIFLGYNGQATIGKKAETLVPAVSGERAKRFQFRKRYSDLVFHCRRLSDVC